MTFRPIACCDPVQLLGFKATSKQCKHNADTKDGAHVPGCTCSHQTRVQNGSCHPLAQRMQKLGITSTAEDAFDAYLG